MSRRTTLIRNKYLRHGRTIEEYCNGKLRTVFGRREAITSAEGEALGKLLAKSGRHATSRPMSPEKRNRLITYFSQKK